MQLLTLSESTVLPDLNKKEQKEADFARTELALSPLKYKHFRAVLSYPEVDQMHRLMLAVTGLSEDDLGELVPNDAAQLSEIVFKSIQKYMELGQQIIRGIEKK